MLLIVLDEVRDILEKQLKKRPNRESLVQKNILPDSSAAPSLQSVCQKIKKLKKLDDLNERLNNRPGPLELIESRILVASDTTFTEAIKDGKIVYPRTSDIITNKLTPYHHDTFFNLEDAANFNFNFNNLTDNDDSNASQTSTSTSKTNNTIASLSSSSFSSFNLSNAKNLQLNNQQQLVNANNSDINNLNELFVPSPASSISTSIMKSSPAPHSPFDLFNNSNNKQTNNKISSNNSCNNLQTNKKLSKSFSSASSTTSSHSSSNKSAKSTNMSNGKKLIFHEYKGPNQKSSKTVVSGSYSSTKQSSKKLLKQNSVNNSNNSTPTNNNSNTNLINSTSSSNITTNINSNNNEFFEDSNDSSTTQVEVSNENDAYKIRLEQQKIFLLHNNIDEFNKNLLLNKNNKIQNKDNEMIIDDQYSCKLNNENDIDLVTSTNNNLNNNNNNNINNQQSQVQNLNNLKANSIQLVPIGDIQNLNCLLPIRTISVAQFNNNSNNNNSNQNNQNVNSVITPTIISNNNSNNNIIQNENNNINQTFKIISSNNNHNPTASTASSNIYSLDSVSGTLTPVIITTASPANVITATNSIPITNTGNQNQSDAINSNHNNNNNNNNNKLVEDNDLQFFNKLPQNYKEMNMNELKEECAKRKLSKSGPKQKLIDRLESFHNNLNSNSTTMNQQQSLLSNNIIKTQPEPQILQRQQPSLNGPAQAPNNNSIKSPDSGVNMDSSPSFISCEASPCSSSNSVFQINVCNNPSLNIQGQKQNKKINSIPSNSNNSNQTKPPQTPTKKSNTNSTRSSSLDEFFEFLNVEKLGLDTNQDHNNTALNDNIKFNNKNTKNDDQLKLDPFKTNQQIINKTNQNPNTNTNIKLDNNSVSINNDNYFETAADLERSLNKLYVLKENSSVVTDIEHLQKLEQQMQESMQYIMKLKSRQQQQRQEVKPNVNTFEQQQINNGLRLISSEPSFNNQQLNSNKIDFISNTIPHNNIYITNSATQNQIINTENNNRQNQQVNKYNINAQNKNGGDNVYQFDKLMIDVKELSTSLKNVDKQTNNNQEPGLPILFTTCDTANIEDDNSNETLINNQESKRPQFSSNSFYNTNNFDSTNRNIYSNNINNNVIEFKKISDNNNQNSNVEMDWNDQEFYQLCQEIVETNSLFNNNNNNNNNKEQLSNNNSNINVSNPALKQNYIEQNASNNIMMVNENHNQSVLSQSTLKQLQNQSQEPIIFIKQMNNNSSNTNGLNSNTYQLDLNQTSQLFLNPINQQYTNQVINQQGTINDHSLNKINDPLISRPIAAASTNQTNNSVNNTFFIDNNSDTNILTLPWDFESDFNTLTGYLQSPTI